MIEEREKKSKWFIGLNFEILRRANPISPFEFILSCLVFLVVPGIAVILSSFLFLKFLGRFDFGLSLLILFLITLASAALFYFFEKLMTPEIAGRLKSIDPDIKYSSLGFGGHTFILYCPLFFVVYIFFLCIAPENSLKGKLYKPLGFLNKASLVTIAAILVSLGGGRLLSNTSLTKIGGNAAYIFSGPATYVISNALLSAELFIENQNSNFKSGKEILNSIAPFCRNPIVHKTLLIELITSHYAVISEKNGGLKYGEQEVAFGSMIETLNNCRNQPTPPKGFNTIWAFQPTVVFEGAIILTIDMILKRRFYRTAVELIEARLSQIEKDPISEVDINRLREELKTTDAYRFHQAFNQSWVGALF